MQIVVDALELAKLRKAVPSEKLSAYSAQTFTDLATQAFARGDVKNAIALAQAALVLDPDDAPALRLMGHAAQSLGDMKVARQAYQRAVLEDPHDWVSAQGLARIYKDLGRPDVARSIMAALTCDSEVPDAAFAKERS